MPNIVINNVVFLDPRTLKKEDLPVIFLCDDRRSFIGWGIKDHTGGNYNHAGIIHKEGMCVSQDFGGFNEKSIEKYMIPGITLKFWRIKDMTAGEREAIEKAISDRFKLSPWRRGYDFLGTFVGQFLHIKWIQNPFQTFCSEQVNDDYIKSVHRCDVMNINEPAPSELNFIFVKWPNLMECIGYCLSD